MSTVEATKSINIFLNQIDQKSEIIPFNNLEKFLSMLEFIKGSDLEKEELIVAKKIFTTV